MTCNKKIYQNNNETIIIDTQNYGSNLNNNLDDVTNLDNLDQINNYENNYLNIKLPHQKSFNENINNIYDTLINIYNMIINGENLFYNIYSSADLIFGLIFILIILFLIIIILKNII